MIILGKTVKPLPELVEIKQFLRRKKITFRELGYYIHYSTPHIIRVFNGQMKASDKFMNSLIRGVSQILKKDLKEFKELIKETQWTTFKLDSSLLKEFSY